MRVERFEDLIAWKKARVLAREVYGLTRTRDFSGDFALVRQIQRAAVSIMANIAEGFDREGAVEFHRYVSIARGSCSELASHLYLARDLSYVADDDFTRIRERIRDVSNLLRALRASLERAKPGRRRGGA